MEQRFPQQQVPGQGGAPQPPPQMQQPPMRPMPDYQIDFYEIVKQLDPSVQLEPDANTFLGIIASKFVNDSLNEIIHIAKTQNKTVIDNECLQTAWQVLRPNYKSQSRNPNAPKTEPSQNHKQISQMVKNFQASKYHTDDN